LFRLVCILFCVNFFVNRICDDMSSYRENCEVTNAYDIFHVNTVTICLSLHIDLSTVVQT